MPQKSFPFASATIKSRESSILTREKALRLLGAKDAEEAMKMLGDFGYETEGVAPVDFEVLLSAQLKKMCKFIEGVTPSKEVTDLFFAAYDYHNAKAWYKAAMKGQEPEASELIDAGNYPIAKLFEILKDKKYNLLSQEMRSAFADIEKRFSVKPDVSLVGLILDAAYAQEVARRVASIKDPAVKDYFSAWFDFTNITLIIRMKRAGTPKDIFDRAILPGGTIDTAVLRRIYDVDERDMADMFSRTRYAEAAQRAFQYLEETGKLVMFHKEKEDYLMKVAVANRSDMFSIGPVIGFIVATQREIQAIRMIMTAKLNDMDADSVAKILPELPA